MKKLTALVLPTLAPGEYPDHTVPGLLFRIGHRERRWELRYRAGGVRKRIGLGSYPAMGLLDARSAAKKATDRIEVGAPALEATPVHPRKDALTLGGLIDQFEKLRRKEGAGGTSFELGFRSIRSVLADYLSMPARQFSKRDLRAARDAIGEKYPHAANRFLAVLNPAMRWASQEDLIAVNFVPDVRKYDIEKARDRVLTGTEIAKIWHVCGQLQGPSATSFGRMVKFALVTLQRRDECASLKFGHIIDTNLWRQRENKTRRENRLRLPDLAMSLIGTGEVQTYCFAGVSGKISGFSKLKRELDRLSNTSGWRLHDLRRTGASMMQELGISRDVIQGVLGHAISDVGGVYLRSQMQTAKGEALAAWATELGRIVGAKRAAQ